MNKTNFTGCFEIYKMKYALDKKKKTHKVEKVLHPTYSLSLVLIAKY